MLNNYKQLTGRYLKASKKRTTLTIIGIVLSVALISTIGLFFKGMQDAQVEDTKGKYGSFHILYKNANEDLISKISNNPKVGRWGLCREGEEIDIGGDTKIEELIASNKALELLGYKVKKGSFPQKSDEVAMEDWILRRINKNSKVGEKIRIKDKEYILSGVLEDSVANQINGKSVILTINNNIKKEDSLMFVEVSSKTNLKQAMRELRKLGTKDTIVENTILLATEGAIENDDSWKGFYLSIGVIVLIVIISTIAVIYNSFHISVVERIKQFGLLRAIGTTPKQIRKIVFREASILALIAVPIGLLCGVIAVYGIKAAFILIGGSSVLSLKVSISPIILGGSAIVGLISIYMSAFIPAFFAGRISPLVAISSRNSITKEKIKKRKHSVMSKLMGFEGSMASKNIKRNRKRYRITVFSILISVMLFVAFKSFMDMTLTITNKLNESNNIHYSIMKDYKVDNTGDTLIDNSLYEKIKGLKNVKDVYKSYDSEVSLFQAVIDRKSESKDINDIGKIYNKISLKGEEKTLINSYLAIYDKASMEVAKKYLKSGNIDTEKMNSENGVIVIARNRIRNPKTNKAFVGPIADIKVGDEIQIQKEDPSKDKIKFGEGNVKKVKVMAVVEDDPFNFPVSNEALKVVTTEEVGKMLIDKSELKPSQLNIIIKDINKKEEARAEIEEAIKDKSSLMITNNIDESINKKSTILMVQILVYGFVAVVSLIGSVNIINTLTTNIILRKREFGALKSIGLTQKGLRKMITLEGLLYGVAGAIYGSVVGCGLSYVLYKGMSGIRNFAWPIPWNAIAIASAAAIIIGYISVLSPLNRIKKENLIESIREEC